MKDFPDESIDLIVTDPPYGYSFMGKVWDKVVPSVEVWKECLRVLKGGAFMFVMSAPRQDILSQMIVRLGSAGFGIGFTSIYWAYASGFPKAMNIGKVVDKKLGIKSEVLGIVKGMGKQNPDWNGTNQGRSENFFKPEYEKVKPTSVEAKTLDGSYAGFQPKPAVEIIIVCMKPLAEKTFVDQALKNGKGVTWLDNARIPFESTDNIIAKNPHTQHKEEATYEDYHKRGNDVYELPKGRFPANLLVSDDVLNDGRIIKTTYVKSTYQQNREGEFLGELGHSGNQGYDDSGSFSRFFDLDKWFDKTVENLPESVRKAFPFLICPKASKSERNKGCEDRIPEQVNDGRNKLPDNAFQRGITLRKNIHPTVKPLKLMSYLVTLGSRPKDVVLDPFVGSGTTCLAAKMLNRKYIGIEIEEEYVKIANMRLEPFKTMLLEDFF